MLGIKPSSPGKFVWHWWYYWKRFVAVIWKERNICLCCKFVVYELFVSSKIKLWMRWQTFALFLLLVLEGRASKRETICLSLFFDLMLFIFSRNLKITFVYLLISSLCFFLFLRSLVFYVFLKCFLHSLLHLALRIYVVCTHFNYLLLHWVIGFSGLGVACWPLVPKFAVSNPAEVVEFLGRKNPQHAFLRRGSKAVGPMS